MLTREQAEIGQLARDFAEREIRPHSALWDQRRDLGGEIFASLAEVGFLGMLVPERYGGLGLDLGSYLAAVESLAWGDGSVALAVAAHAGAACTVLLRHGSESIRETLLPKLASGEIIGTVAFGKPGEGRGSEALPRARRTDGGWRLEGRAAWVPNGVRADLALVLACTDDADGVGVFVVESDEMRVGPPVATMGLRALATAHVELDGVDLPEERVVGDPVGGRACIDEAAELESLSIAAQAVGTGRAAFEHAMAYSAEREQFGRPLSHFEAIREKLATMATRLAESRALLWTARAAIGDGPEAGEMVPHAGGEEASVLAAMAKLSASETAVQVTDEAVQIFGGYGYMRDYPVEKLMRDAKGAEIFGGTNRAMRSEIAGGVIPARR